MTKTIELYAVCQGTGRIAVRLSGTDFEEFTSLHIRQEMEGTKMWDCNTGKEIALPKNRYRLCDDIGLRELAYDLDKMGLLGLSYYVKDAVINAEPFNTGDECLDDQLMSCYEDTFYLGDFLTDKDAIEAAKSRQSDDDDEAILILEDAGFSDIGASGACYPAHLFRLNPDDTETQVEE